MLLSVSVLSSIVVGIIGYVNGTEALRAIAYDRLVEIRENRSREVDAAVHDGRERRAAGRDERDEQRGGRAPSRPGSQSSKQQELDAAASAQVDAYYRDTFAADLSEATGEDVDGSAFAPRGGAQEYLQYHYVIPYEDWEAAIQNEDAGRRQRLVGGPRPVPRLLQGDDGAPGLRRRPHARHRGQRRLLGVQGRRPRHEPLRRSVPALEPLRGVHARRWTATSSAMS